MPATVAYSTINASSVEEAGVILDNTKPAVNRSYGVRSLSPNGTYYGRHHFTQVWASIRSWSSIRRRLSHYHWMWAGACPPSTPGAPGKILTFTYVVAEDEQSSHLNIYGDGSQALAFSG